MFDELSHLINASYNLKNMSEVLVNKNVSDVDDYGLFNLILDRTQLVMTSIGLVANAMTAITLLKHGEVGAFKLSVYIYV